MAKSAGDDTLREAVTLLRNEGIELHVRVTWEKGDAARYVAEAVELGVATVIAGGGDGTINEVATALVNAKAENVPALGIYLSAPLTILPPAQACRKRWIRRCS
ncbi:lipid kinase [Pseudescherichia vulneris]|nr:lipid kinase [Pseudescherichia vulneris]